MEYIGNPTLYFGICLPIYLRNGGECGPARRLLHESEDPSWTEWPIHDDRRSWGKYASGPKFQHSTTPRRATPKSRPVFGSAQRDSPASKGAVRARDVCCSSLLQPLTQNVCGRTRAQSVEYLQGSDLRFAFAIRQRPGLLIGTSQPLPFLGSGLPFSGNLQAER